MLKSLSSCLPSLMGVMVMLRHQLGNIFVSWDTEIVCHRSALGAEHEEMRLLQGIFREGFRISHTLRENQPCLVVDFHELWAHQLKLQTHSICARCDDFVGEFIHTAKCHIFHGCVVDDRRLLHYVGYLKSHV